MTLVEYDNDAIHIGLIHLTLLAEEEYWPHCQYEIGAHFPRERTNLCMKMLLDEEVLGGVGRSLFDGGDNWDGWFLRAINVELL